MRADARRNRTRVLEAAEAVFASKGPSASTEEIARHAGVAIGTVFRNFPTKEALIEAVFVDRLRRLADEAESLATADDPGAAFFAYLTDVVERSATKHAFTDALSSASSEARAVRSAIAQAGKDLHEAVGKLLTRAQQAGAVREDVRIPELMALLIGASRAMEHAGRDSHTKARTLAIIFDGLRRH